MARNRYVDPTTGDYVLVDGTPRNDDTANSEIVLALRSKRGDGVDPNYGSRLHTIRKLTPSASKLAEVYAREAVQFLIDRGAMRNPRFSVVQDPELFALLVTVSYTNRAGVSVDLPVTVPLV